jgi:hypothetical protein
VILILRMLLRLLAVILLVRLLWRFVRSRLSPGPRARQDQGPTPPASDPPWKGEKIVDVPYEEVKEPKG